ncbi:MAG: class I SAM-dependent RNA methyltransferase [Anaerolineae bacterium]|nr:class I SAM-dependent RNA methyltransferase [Anaerolineae bacterium]
MPSRKPRKSTNRRQQPSARNNKRPNDKRSDGAMQLEITGMANGGYGLAHHHKRTILLPYVIPGEIVQAQLTHSEKNVDFASGTQLVEASGDREYPRCPHFGPNRCWGCQWQHISYDAQLLLKQDVIADQLQRAGKFDDRTLERAMRPVLPAPKQWQYNHQITYTRLKDGRFGLPQMDSRQYEAIDVCHVLHPDLQDLYESLDVDFPQMKTLTLILGSDGQPMLILGMSEETAPELETGFPASVNIVLPDNEPMNLIGDSYVRYQVKNHWLRATAGVAFRANVEQVPLLVDTVLAQLNLKPEDTLLDLYAGVGLYAKFAAPLVEWVTVVESYPPAATDADENLADVENVDIIEGGVEAVLQAMNEDEAHYSAAIVDPPPFGLSKDATTELLKMGPERIVYVSSNPATLGRDGLKLTKAGYRLEQVQPIDFAPQTYYMDMVALFVKG